MRFLKGLVVLLVAGFTACSFNVTPSSPSLSGLPDPATDIVSPQDSELLPMQTDTPLADGSKRANANVEFVRAVQTADGSWIFYVTVSHLDTGWEDYADGWDVLLPDGTVLKPDPDSPFTRLLLHPHETEQPFTRSQSGILIPEDVVQVRVRAHDIVDGFGGAEILLILTQESGPGYEVQR